MNKFLSLLALGLIFISCNRKGCADPYADNYDEKVVKAKNSECTYNGETESPCGDQIEFCSKLDGTNLSGDMTVSNGTNNSIVLKWTNGSSSNQKSLEIEIYKPENGTFVADGSFQDGTFTVLYTDGQTTEYDVSGTLTISEYTSSNGLSATFSSDLTNGRKLTKGFLHKVK